MSEEHPDARIHFICDKITELRVIMMYGSMKDREASQHRMRIFAQELVQLLEPKKT